ncbi:DUF4302 domain-containing protein [Mucilaginibacter lappiensis]|uniref:DUF4302 domain-containing protein n=1 Tax=Mucilaginibacter lappiensis TaxID=354630 RepID=A0A841JUY4_9SPHI|nr:DUF4302 domain-containing protein [Mucilaginibacter lappiensis]MBB6131631.1 hypothetical protein [Mucilaginibacter lappiensis]
MKTHFKLLYISLSLLIGLTACKKNDTSVFNKTPNQREAEALKNYETLIAGAPYGWKATLFPAGGGAYSFSMKFDSSGHVNMLSDLDFTKSTTSQQSSYRLRGQMAPSLLFDTYSYIHLLSDPTPSVNGGAVGVGYTSDFEFAFDKVTGDSVTLIGNKNGSKLTLVKASSQENYGAFVKLNATFFASFNQIRTYFKRTTINGTDCDVHIDPQLRQITLTYISQNNSTSVSSPFYIDESANLIFLTPVTIGSATLTAIKSIKFDQTNRVFTGTINSNAMQIKEAIAPLKYDLTAVSAFTVNLHPDSHFKDAWVSDNGFTVDNKIDGFGVNAIPGLDYILYYPLTTTKENGTKIGFYSNAAGFFPYGPEIIPSVSNGIISFTFWGSYGTPPAAIAFAVNSTTTKFIDPKGFYVIATGSNTYDLVSVADARAWISFY